MKVKEALLPSDPAPAAPTAMPRVLRPRRAAPADAVRPTRAEINLGHLRHNLKVVKRAASVASAAVATAAAVTAGIAAARRAKEAASTPPEPPPVSETPSGSTDSGSYSGGGESGGSVPSL